MTVGARLRTPRNYAASLGILKVAEVGVLHEPRGQQLAHQVKTNILQGGTVKGATERVSQNQQQVRQVSQGRWLIVVDLVPHGKGLGYLLGDTYWKISQ